MPRTEPDSYVVYPTRYDEIKFNDKKMFTLMVVNGHAWGWSVRPGPPGMSGSHRALNKKGEWISERRGHGNNKYRRWSREEAIALAEKYVDTIKFGYWTVDEACAVEFK